MEPVDEIVEGLLSMPQTKKVFFSDRPPYRFGVLTYEPPDRVKTRLPYHYYFGDMMEKFPQIDFSYRLSSFADELFAFVSEVSEVVRVRVAGGRKRPRS